MTIFDQINFQGVALRVKDKDANITFYQKTLGLTLLREENALALFGSLKQNRPLFTLEESPDYRTREARGHKKLAKLMIKVLDPREIESLLAQSIKTEQVFLGEKGYAFEARSPQGDLVLLHSEDDLAKLSPISHRDYQKQADFKGLTDYRIDGLSLHVTNLENTRAFYQQLPLKLDLKQSQDQDLSVNPNETWDLEIIHFEVAKDYDLNHLAQFFTDKGIDFFLDKKETILVVSDPSNIEVWFQK
ncbi:CppA N-terminal domain-containing protein [Streptococcus sp. sy010]|uniref:CppA N-terminal domain-containing protein n=1 Tax=Streptococcus sp. sy010 TaxID=2600148 RepID=UPI0011B56403|nr:CppA N-terminal domain-containing protein [Streptococcus sp. sy010]TWT16187.1 peptidase [Streptococcus sp. sy010]